MTSEVTKPWEYGGEFHWPFVTEVVAGPTLPAETVVFGSGRDAIRALIATGMRARGWRRWFVPTYFCEEVTACIALTGLEVVRYEDSPLLPAPPPLSKKPRLGDAFLLVNYFGLRGAGAADALDYAPADLIEDHTHDPWSRWAWGSHAHYCIASLRKTLPIPGAGAVWSPQCLTLPDPVPPTRMRRDAMLMKLGAMMIKALYLEGHAVSKESYRALQLSGEEGIASGDIAGLDPVMTRMLAGFPWESWRCQRRANHAVLARALREAPGIEVLPPSADEGSCPFAVVTMFADTALRDSLRTDLIATGVYPSILWPIVAKDCPEFAGGARLAKRTLALACDSRYNSTDLLKVATLVQASLEAHLRRA